VKAIINGKRYNTDTATLIGESGSAGLSYSDFRQWSAGLYKTRSGRFFLAGEGGPMTQFAHHYDDGGRSSGEKIIPLDSYQAMAWAERELSAEVVETAFASSLEDA
jgi:hypothetical protein